MKEETKNKNKNIKKEHNDKKHDKQEDVVKITAKEIEEINKKTAEAEEKFLRAQADLVNYRKRKDEEVERLLKFANEDLIMELLPIIDNFERAIKLESSDNNLMDGVKMIHKSLLTALEKYGVKEIECIDKKFDPMYHQAVMTEENDQKEQDVILEVLQKGYMLKDKVIRPPMVKVNK